MTAVRRLRSGAPGARCAHPPRGRGFTLIELMVTIVVVAVLLTIAVPSMREFILSSTLTSYANDVVASTHLARSEAFKRNIPVSMCVSANGTSCTTGNWSQGWVVFLNPNRNATIDAGDTILQRRQVPSGTGLSITSTGGATLHFDPTGVDVTETTVTICQNTPTAGSQERVVTMSATGRTSVTKTTTGSCT